MVSPRSGCVGLAYQVSGDPQQLTKMFQQAYVLVMAYDELTICNTFFKVNVLIWHVCHDIYLQCYLSCAKQLCLREILLFDD